MDDNNKSIIYAGLVILVIAGSIFLFKEFSKFSFFKKNCAENCLNVSENKDEKSKKIESLNKNEEANKKNENENKIQCATSSNVCSNNSKEESFLVVDKKNISIKKNKKNEKDSLKKDEFIKKVNEIKNRSDFKKIFNQNKKNVFLIYTNNCPFCSVIESSYNNLPTKYPNFNFYRFNGKNLKTREVRDKGKDGKKTKISTFPTFLFTEAGIVKESMSDSDFKKLIEKLDKF